MSGPYEPPTLPTEPTTQWIPASQPGYGWPGAYPPPPPPPRRRHTGLVIALVVVFAMLLAGAAGVGVGLGRWLRLERAATTAQNGPTVAPPGGVTIPTGSAGGTGSGGSADPDAISAAVDPGVVDVNTVLGLQDARAAGTGVIIESAGIVLTNNHVVAGATSISVTTVSDGKAYQAAVIGYDRSDDIAVLRLSGASGLHTVTLADSSTVQVGDQIVAIGNARGAGGTPSVVPGTVTGLDRSIDASDESTGSVERLSGLIQIAAAIEPGDSGGPLVNANAQVIGIDTAASAGFQYQSSGGEGFAIPITTAVGIANQILVGHASTTVHLGTTAFMGVQIAPSTRQGNSGAVLAGVVPSSPAQAAGLTDGDTIVALDGQTVDSPTTLTSILDEHHPGDQVRVDWVDSSGHSSHATLQLASGPVG